MRHTPLPEIVNAEALAKILGITPTTISRLVREERLTKTEGGFRLAESVQAYVAFRSKPEAQPGRRAVATDDPNKIERTRLAREQADRIVAQNATARAELLPAAEVERTWAETLRRLRGEMLALPSRIGARLGHLTRHDLSEVDLEIRSVLTELAGGSDAAS